MNQGPPDSSNNQPPPIIGNCLNCQGLVRIPAQTTASAAVRCPHCGESFSLAAILEQAVPELEVIEPSAELKIDTGSTTAPAEIESLEDFVVPSQLSKGARGRRRKKRSDKSKSDSSRSTPKVSVPDSDSETDSNSETDFASLSEGIDETSSNEASLIVESANDSDAIGSDQSESFESVQVDVSESQPTQSTPRSRRDDRRERERESRRESSNRRNSSRRKPASNSQSPIGEIVKVVFGAFLAIPIAYLFVFWIFNRDPLNVGPAVSNVAPFLVPEEFHGNTEPEEEDASDVQGEKKRNGGSSNKKEPLVVDPEKGLAIPELDPDLLGK